MSKSLTFDEIKGLISDLDDPAEFLTALGADHVPPEGDVIVAMLSRVAHAAYEAGMANPGVVGEDGNIINVGDVFEDTKSGGWQIAEGINRDGYIITEWTTATNPKNCRKVDSSDKQKLIKRTSVNIVHALQKRGVHMGISTTAFIDDILRIFAYQIEDNWEDVRHHYIDEDSE